MEFNKVVLIWENLTFDTHRWHHQVFLRILHHNACYNSTAVTFISTKINWKYSRCAMIETFHPAKGMFPGHLIFVILLNRQNVYTNFYPHKMYNVLILNFTISTKIPLKSMIFLSEISWHVRFFSSRMPVATNMRRTFGFRVNGEGLSWRWVMSVNATSQVRDIPFT